MRRKLPVDFIVNLVVVSLVDEFPVRQRFRNFIVKGLLGRLHGLEKIEQK